MAKGEMRKEITHILASVATGSLHGVCVCVCVSGVCKTHILTFCRGVVVAPTAILPWNINKKKKWRDSQTDRS